MSYAYTLRPAPAGDYDFLYALHVATIRAAVEATWGWDDAFQARYFHEHFVPEEIQVILVEGQEVGVLRLEERDGDLFIALIEIAPAFQGPAWAARSSGTWWMRPLREGAVSLHVLKATGRAPDAAAGLPDRRDAGGALRHASFRLCQRSNKPEWVSCASSSRSPCAAI